MRPSSDPAATGKRQGKRAGIPFISTRPGGGGAVRPYVSMGPKILGLEILEVPPGGFAY